METVLFLVASYGICFGLMNDKASFITRPLKRLPLFPDGEGKTFFSRMLSCPYCTGFHAGWITWLLMSLPKDLSPQVFSGILLHAFAASAFCYLADITAEMIESR